MRALLKRLYRERRRLLVVAVLTFLGGYLAFYKSVATLMGFPMWLVAGLAFMIGLTTFLMVIVVLFPKLRHCAESAALAVPVLSLMGLFSGAESGGISTAAGLYMALFA